MASIACDHVTIMKQGSRGRGGAGRGRGRAVANDSYRSQRKRDRVRERGRSSQACLVAIKLTRSNMFVRVCESVCSVRVCVCVTYV